MKLEVLVAVPPGVTTLIGPVSAPSGTVARSSLPETSSKPVAATWSNRTSVAPPRRCPLMVTRSPGRPRSGAKAVISGVSGSSLSMVTVTVSLSS